LSPFLRFGKNAAKRRSLLIWYPRAKAHGYRHATSSEVGAFTTLMGIGKFWKAIRSFSYFHRFYISGKNVAKRRSLLILYPRAKAHGYYYVAPMELVSFISFWLC